MVDLANEKIEEDKIDDLINSLFNRSGFDNKAEITFENFKQMMNEYQDDLNVIALNVECNQIFTRLYSIISFECKSDIIL